MKKKATFHPYVGYRGTTEERFWAKVDKNYICLCEYCLSHTGYCWPWLGAHDKKGYGIFALKRGPNNKGVNIGAHRFSLQLAKGPIPKELATDHLCRNPPCCNPAHLEVVTTKENVHRSRNPLIHDEIAKTHCPKGHPYSGDNLKIRRGSRECRECDRIQAHQQYLKYCEEVRNNEREPGTWGHKTKQK